MAISLPPRPPTPAEPREAKPNRAEGMPRRKDSQPANRKRCVPVMVVDDHPVVRMGIRYALLSYPDMVLVGEAGSGEEALRLVRALRPRVILMDLMMPGMDGIATIRTMLRQDPEVRIIVLTGLEEGDSVREALLAGAIGYHLKGSPMAALIHAIRAAARDQISLDPVAAQMLAQATMREPLFSSDLTEREHDVLRLLVQGLQNEAIAEQLVISVATVKFHIRTIRRKLRATNRTHIVALALRHHLVPPA